MPTIISAIMSIFTSVVTGVSEAEREKFALELAKCQEIADMAKAQSDTNTAEAQNANMFVAGWRPAVGWVCALAFAWQFVVQPICVFWMAATGHHIVLPQFDYGTMSSVLMGMLGLGAMRTYEKINGQNSK